MILRKLWDRIQSRPSPNRPAHQLFLTTGLGFLLGLMAGPFVPPSWAMDQIPVRIDLPFRVASIAALCAFTAIGGLLLGPVGRKRFFVVMAVLAFLLIVGGAVLLYPLLSGPDINFDALKSTTGVLWGISWFTLAVILIGAGTGWARWFSSDFRNDR